jgi:hypothetical protein
MPCKKSDPQIRQPKFQNIPIQLIENLVQCKLILTCPPALTCNRVFTSAEIIYICYSKIINSLSYLLPSLWYFNLQFPKNLPYEILRVRIISPTPLHLELPIPQIVVLTTGFTCIALRYLNYLGDVSKIQLPPSSKNFATPIVKFLRFVQQAIRNTQTNSTAESRVRYCDRRWCMFLLLGFKT